MRHAALGVDLHGDVVLDAQPDGGVQELGGFLVRHGVFFEHVAHVGAGEFGQEAEVTQNGDRPAPRRRVQVAQPRFEEAAPRVTLQRAHVAGVQAGTIVEIARGVYVPFWDVDVVQAGDEVVQPV